MNQQEFNQWWSDFKLRFPDMGNSWFAEGRTAEVQRQILTQWSDVLSDVTLAEAAAVNRGMHNGDLASFTGKWDRDTVPATVRKHAMNSRVSNTWSGPNDDPYPQPKGEYLNLGGTLSELLDLQKHGATRQQCAEFLRKRFPPARADRQRRFSCAQCLDSGRVELWHDDRVFYAMLNGIESPEAGRYKTMTAACGCKAGDVFANRKIPLQRYDTLKHCLALPGGDVESHEAVNAFETWVRDHRAIKHQSREADFAQQEAF